jgi:hypothetical protein
MKALGESRNSREAKRWGISSRKASRTEESWHEFSNQDLCHDSCLQRIKINVFNNMAAILAAMGLIQQHCPSEGAAPAH